jgi:hypothetical protein
VAVAVTLSKILLEPMPTSECLSRGMVQNVDVFGRFNLHDGGTGLMGPLFRGAGPVPRTMVTAECLLH